ncbi:hypothetical protein CIL03_05370 [Virgibacillus indicus]|uniref:YolD-like family protein n=1 Tax=Virgibacillus indicus TaxID=2024554 RepID=A0A265NGM6_9BACI|nr:YolD-like family protein [Virgibacillus indicus]OZU90574.1 hypothetical protein CIL03_05370 [Virgibacillus indicus]
MSANDRGTIKWVSLMLPEHVQMLNEMWEEDEYKEKPILDEQKIMEIDASLQCAIHNDLTVAIKFFENRSYHTAKGKILKIDSLNKTLQLRNQEETKVSLYNVIDVFID